MIRLNNVYIVLIFKYIEAYIADIQVKEEKFNAVGYINGPAFTSENWKNENQTNRHIITRITSNGLHHKLCVQQNFHEINDECICKFCHNQAHLYHIIDCTARDNRFLTLFAGEIDGNTGDPT